MDKAVGSTVKRAAVKIVSKLAEDSHKGINRHGRHKSDRRGSVRKLSARRGRDAGGYVLSDEHRVPVHEGTSLIILDKFARNS